MTDDRFRLTFGTSTLSLKYDELCSNGRLLFGAPWQQETLHTTFETPRFLGGLSMQGCTDNKNNEAKAGRS
jgi:hypothetical protein